MKVILTQEVKGRGSEGDVIDVAHGFAVNYLLPRKMAVEATSGNMKQLEARKGNIKRRNDDRRTAAEGAAGAITGKTVVIGVKAGDDGKLFGSVTPLMVEVAVLEQLGVEVDHRKMDLHGHIKKTGDYPVTVGVFSDVKADVLVRVVPEGADLTVAAEAAPVEEVAEAGDTAEAGSEPVDEPVDESVDESAGNEPDVEDDESEA
jgi:large subunit ribosomal protein L9